MRTGRASAVRTCAATGVRSAARTVGASTRTGRATRWPRWKLASERTIVSPAASRSSATPVRAARTTGCRPCRTIAASRCGRLTAFAILPTSKTSARSSTRVGGETSAPKTRTPIRRKPRIGPTPPPWSSASLTAAPQSASTPRLTGFSRHSCPPAVNVTGTSARALARRSSFARASPVVSPPTLMPSILTPAAIRSDEPAKTNPSTAPPTAKTIASTPSRCASSALERLRRRLRTRTGPVPASTRKTGSVAASSEGRSWRAWLAAGARWSFRGKDAGSARSRGLRARRRTPPRSEQRVPAAQPSFRQGLRQT